MSAVNGSLIPCTDKVHLMHGIKAATHIPATVLVSETQVPTNRILIIDAMAVLQCMK